MVHHARTASWIALAAATALVLTGCAGTGGGGDQGNGWRHYLTFQALVHSRVRKRVTPRSIRK